MHHVPGVLASHLRNQLGAWPPTGPLDVVASGRREEPSWDGLVRPLMGISAPDLGAVLSVAPAHHAAVEAAVAAAGRDPAHPDLVRAVPAALGLGGEVAFGAGIYRWTEQVTDLPDTGVWVDPADPRLPDWLHPFGGGVLAVFDDDDRYLAGVGIKDHDHCAEEISVGTEAAARGRGLARALVATAAREILRRGAIPLYLHVPHNHASARVAEATGFGDHGWRVLGLWPTADLEQPPLPT